MAVTSNSTTDGLAVTVTFTEQGAQCIPAPLLEAFKNANWRITLPTGAATPGEVTMRASSLPDSIARVDSEGTIYVPGWTIVTVLEQTVILNSTTAPGTPVDMTIAVPGVSDLANYIDNIYFEVTPASAAVNIGPPRIVGNNYVRSITRVGDPAAAGPFPVVTVRGSGRLIRVPSPNPT